VAGQPLTKAEYDRWRVIALASTGQAESQLTLETAAALREQVLQVLIERRWMEGEARQRKLSVTTAQVNREYRKQKREAFDKPAEFERFLRTSRQTIADLKWRVRDDLLARRVEAHVVGGAKTVRGRNLRIDRFLADFTARWHAQTVCVAGYATQRHCGSVVAASA
jgi:FKBP-type peptidyl-prolyl cis-trans isomerase (trigger factor)